MRAYLCDILWFELVSDEHMSAVWQKICVMSFTDDSHSPVTSVTVCKKYSAVLSGQA